MSYSKPDPSLIKFDFGTQAYQKPPASNLPLDFVDSYQADSSVPGAFASATTVTISGSAVGYTQGTASGTFSHATLNEILGSAAGNVYSATGTGSFQIASNGTLLGYAEANVGYAYGSFVPAQLYTPTANGVGYVQAFASGEFALADVVDLVGVHFVFAAGAFEFATASPLQGEHPQGADASGDFASANANLFTGDADNLTPANPLATFQTAVNGALLGFATGYKQGVAVGHFQIASMSIMYGKASGNVGDASGAFQNAWLWPMDGAAIQAVGSFAPAYAQRIVSATVTTDTPGFAAGSFASAKTDALRAIGWGGYKGLTITRSSGPYMGLVPIELAKQRSLAVVLDADYGETDVILSMKSDADLRRKFGVHQTEVSHGIRSALYFLQEGGAVVHAIRVKRSGSQHAYQYIEKDSV